MNKLSMDKRLEVLTMLIEGESIPVTSRSLGISANTVTKLLVEIGAICLNFHNDMVKNQVFENIQHKEIWSYTLPPDDIWTLIKIDSDSGFVIEWCLGRHVNDGVGVVVPLIDKNLLSNRLHSHIHMLSLYFLFYNFCRDHEAFHHTPAVQAGLSQVPYDIEWISGLSD